MELIEYIEPSHIMSDQELQIINSRNQKLYDKMLRPLLDLSVIRNTLDEEKEVRNRPKHYLKITGMRKCARCGKYFPLEEIKRKGHNIYCLKDIDLVDDRPRGINYLRP